MNRTALEPGVGGWCAPCAAFDYEKMEREAEREREAVRERLEQKKREKSPNAERELLRRREVRLLTDMYYEQRGNALALAEKKLERQARRA